MVTEFHVHLKHRYALLIVIGALGALWVGAGSARASGCSASALRLTSDSSPAFEPIRANPARYPCVDDYHGALRANGTVGPGTVYVTTGALDARTDVAPLQAPAADYGVPDTGCVNPPGCTQRTSTIALATADVDSVTITSGVNRISAQGLRAYSSLRSYHFGIAAVGASAVAQVTVNGVTTEVGNTSLDIPIPGAGTLHVNSIVYSCLKATARALWLEGVTDNTNVIVAESVAHYFDYDVC